MIAVFCIAAILLLIYGMGLNIYRNKMNNIMISDVVEKGFQEYTDFLNEAETKNVLNQKMERKLAKSRIDERANIAPNSENLMA